MLIDEMDSGELVPSRVPMGCVVRGWMVGQDGGPGCER